MARLWDSARNPVSSTLITAIANQRTWPGKGKDSYGLSGRGRNKDKSESSLRAFANQLRAETAQQLEQRIGEAEGGATLQQAAPTGGFGTKRRGAISMKREASCQELQAK
jgi:hypothetical protein